MTFWQKVKLFGRSFVAQVLAILREIAHIPLAYWLAMVAVAAIGDLVVWIVK